jgi:modulator of FtsH protease
MDRNVQRLDVLNGGAAYGVDTHRVLRNTYWLLALSMVPTVLGAWIGVQTGALAHMANGPSVLLFFVGAFGLMFGVQHFRNSSIGVFMLLGFTFFMGLMLSRLLAAVLGGYSNGASLIMTAFGGTAAVFFGMASMATVVKRDLSGLARFLMVGVMIAIVASLINIFFAQSTALMLTISTAMTVVFSLFIMIDVKRVIDGGETNYVMATLSIYLDLYNLFQNLLVILTSLTGDRR